MHYLLSSHGTPGAIAAEEVALQYCKRGDCLDHLLIIPQWWADMTGDDWLNNGVSRNRYCNYLEQQLCDESEQVFSRIQSQCENLGVQYSPILKIGETSKEFESMVNDRHYSKIFVGSRRPRECIGVNDRMLTNKLMKNVSKQLVLIEHPYATGSLA